MGGKFEFAGRTVQARPVQIQISRPDLGIWSFGASPPERFLGIKKSAPLAPLDGTVNPIWGSSLVDNFYPSRAPPATAAAGYVLSSLSLAGASPLPLVVLILVVHEVDEERGADERGLHAHVQVLRERHLSNVIMQVCETCCVQSKKSKLCNPRDTIITTPNQLLNYCLTTILNLS